MKNHRKAGGTAVKREQRSTTTIADSSHDPVTAPKHYKAHPSGVECIEIVEHMPFCVGNAIKYLWRCGLKNDATEDLKKARWYIDREIQLREKTAPTT